MQYLVDMQLAASSRPSGGAAEGSACIEPRILPSLEACETLLEERRYVQAVRQSERSDS